MSEDSEPPIQAPSPEVPEPSFPSIEELAQLLPQYEIHEIVGVGGMGAVYKARQISLDRWVAIKVMPSEVAQKNEDVQRFITEARAMAKLVHPHIVAVFDFGQTYQRHLYLVMEYVEGSDLHRRTRRGEVTPERALEVIAQLCDALQFAHDHGVAHRDIKPANVLITNDWKVKVADFGLARDLSTQPSPEEIEYGTPDYTAPERLITGATVDERADIYSLGVVIHEMLTGKTPTAAGKDAGKGLPDGFASVISKCTLSDPEERYQKAQDVKKALFAATSGKSESAPNLGQNRVSSLQEEAPSKTASAASLEPIDLRAYSTYRPTIFTRLRPFLSSLAWGGASLLFVSVLGYFLLKDRVHIVDDSTEKKTPKTAAVPDVKKKSEAADSKAPAVENKRATPAPKTAPGEAKMAGTPAVEKVPEKAPAPAVAATAFEVVDGPAGEVLRLKGHTGSVNSVVLLRDQKRVLSASSDGTLRMWDLGSAKELYQVQPCSSSIYHIHLSPDETQALLVSYTSPTLCLIETETGANQAQVNYPTNRLQGAILLGREQGVLVYGSDDEDAPAGNFFSWKPSSADSQLERVEGFVGRIWSVHLNPDRTEIIINSSKRTTPDGKSSVRQFWRFNVEKKLLTPLENPPDSWVTRTFYRQGAGLGFAMFNSPTVFKLPELTPVMTLPVVPKDQPMPTFGAAVTGGQLFVSAWDNSTFRVHHLSGAEQVWQQTLPKPWNHFTLSADERWLVAGERSQRGQSSIGGEFDVVVYRLPAWSSLRTEAEIVNEAKAKHADLAKHDAELAELRQRLYDHTPVPTREAFEMSQAELDSQYTSALRRDYARLSPTEQQAFRIEMQRITDHEPLSSDARVDLVLPPSLQKLRAIYRKQLQSLKSTHIEAVQVTLKSVESVLKPLEEKRRNEGNRLGAALVQIVWDEWSKSSGASAAGTLGDSIAPGGEQSQVANVPTLVQRPSRAGTVFSVERTVKNLLRMTDGSLGRIPSDLKPTVALSGGPQHVYALHADGSLRAWGTAQGVPVVTPALPAPVVQVQSSGSFAAALLQNGEVHSWPVPLADKVTVYKPKSKVPSTALHLGYLGQTYLLFSDGSIEAVNELGPAIPAAALPAKKLLCFPEHGWCTVQPRDGTTVFWGLSSLPATTFPEDLRDVLSISIGSSYAVALLQEGSLRGWGQIATGQSFRLRRYPGAIDVVHDYAGRVFPIHRADHSWELIPNPSHPEYLSEDRLNVSAGRLRGAVQALFTPDYIIALRPN